MAIWQCRSSESVAAIPPETIAPCADGVHAACLEPALDPDVDPPSERASRLEIHNPRPCRACRPRKLWRRSKCSGRASGQQCCQRRRRARVRMRVQVRLHVPARCVVRCSLLAGSMQLVSARCTMSRPLCPDSQSQGRRFDPYTPSTICLPRCSGCGDHYDAPVAARSTVPRLLLQPARPGEGEDAPESQRDPRARTPKP